MKVRQAVAPSYQTLRPLKPPTSSTFPVYPNVADTLAGAAKLPDPTVAHVLATCAGYAYSDAETVGMIMARLGLEDNRCLMIAEAVDAMFICSTAFLVQSRCGRVVILCYRGTEPLNFINWLIDADVNPEKVRFPSPDPKAPAELHGGFYRNVRATRFRIIDALERAMGGRPILDGSSNPGRAIQPLESLYITGHSLGGAMAAVMGAMIATEPAYEALRGTLKAVYTFGQPMVGDPVFARMCAQNPFLNAKVFRYVFGNDIVPELPPVASGPFEHFGAEYRLETDSHGKAKPTERPTTQTHIGYLLGGIWSFLAHQLQVSRKIRLQHSFYDHGPQHYIAALTPADKRTEFGD